MHLVITDEDLNIDMVRNTNNINKVNAKCKNTSELRNECTKHNRLVDLHNVAVSSSQSTRSYQVGVERVRRRE